MAFLVIILIAGISAAQIPGMVKKKLFGEIIVYIVLMGVALLYGISRVNEWNFPPPGMLVRSVLDPVSHLVFPRMY